MNTAARLWKRRSVIALADLTNPMHATTMISRVSGAVALAAIGFAAWQSIKVGQMRAAIADESAYFQTQLEKLESRIIELETREPAPTAGGADTDVASADERLQQQRLVEARRQQQALAKQRAQEAKARAAASEQSRFTSEVQKEHFRQFEAELPIRYRPFHRMMGLSSDQVARFETLMVERYWAFSDLLATRVTQGPGVDEEAFAELKQQGLAVFDEELRALVGESGLHQYEQYERMVNVQGLVQAVAGRLFDTSEPLSAAQADQLLTLLASHGSQSDAQSPGETWLRARIEGRESSANAQWADIDWNAAHPKLGSVLSAPQVAAVQALRDQADARQRAKFLRDEFEQELRLKNEERPAAAPR